MVGPARPARLGCAAAFDLLADYGIPVARSRAAHDVTEVLAAADDVGYPIALKTLGAEHKSDVGGVVLGIADGAALQDAYLAMAAALGPEVSIDAMAAPGVEISVGVVRDDNFGPLVIVAAGGTLVELLADRAVACPPVTRQIASTCFGRCERRRCWRAGVAPRRSTSRRWPTSSSDSQRWQSNSASCWTRWRPTR